MTVDVPEYGERRKVTIRLTNFTDPTLKGVTVDGSTESPHRRGKTDLCLWRWDASSENQWTGDEGLLALIQYVRVHLFREPRRAFLATLTLAGLRISEALDLRWRDVDLSAGRLRVTDSKTDAGVRLVDLLPALRGELSVQKTETGFGGPEDFVLDRERG